MTRSEHLLTILAEECAEVAQRASKLLRFGMEEVEPGQNLTNGDRLFAEWVDLRAVMEMVKDDGLSYQIAGSVAAAMDRKREKVEHFLLYSAKQGTLS